MNLREEAERFDDIRTVCEIHRERMLYAFGKVKHLFPLDDEKYLHLTNDELSYFDQLIFRFSKLQESIGTKYFPVLLGLLGEDISELPFIDILNRLEKLNIIEDRNQWMTLRETRNIVTHEYPFNADAIIDGLNFLERQVNILVAIMDRLNEYVQKRHF